MRSGLANLLLTVRATSEHPVHPVFRPEVWAVGLCLWVVIALIWGAL